MNRAKTVDEVERTGAGEVGGSVAEEQVAPAATTSEPAGPGEVHETATPAPGFETSARTAAAPPAATGGAGEVGGSVAEEQVAPAATTSEPAAEASGSARGLSGPATDEQVAPTTSEPTAEAEPETGGLEAERLVAPTSATGSEPGASAAEPELGEAEPTEPGAPAAESEAATEGEPEAEPTPAEPRPVWLRLPALLLAAAIVLTGAGAWFTVEAHSAAETSAAGNLALTDVGATAEVTSAITLAVNRIFSYSYDRTDVTEKAAAAVLRGAAKDSYDKLFAQVRQKAPEQKLVLTSRVSAIAVQELRDNHARLLVFLDQSAVRADNNATDNAAAQLSVTAERSNGTWVITALEPR
ncbi:hypothetical protein [Amycolatopsis sp. cg9]|uniref:hypothetical protein n=1 Tax=Amycolatopsis sp. cg9 TaxID=3238801 RepID=UPI003525DFD5